MDQPRIRRVLTCIRCGEEGRLELPGAGVRNSLFVNDRVSPIRRDNKRAKTGQQDEDKALTKATNENGFITALVSNNMHVGSRFITHATFLDRCPMNPS